jgi:transporter family-2 protein
MEKIIYAVVTIIVGTLIGFHLAMNGKLGMEFSRITTDSLRSAAAANLFFWVIGATVAFIYYMILQPGSFSEFFRIAPKPLLLAGVLGASIVFAVTFLIPGKTGGAGNGFIYLVVGQVIIGMLLSHFGLLGSSVDPVSIKKIIGITLLLGGLYFSVLA